MKREHGTPRAFIQYNCIPHYRARIFELLSACKQVEFTIVADTNSDTPFLKTLGGGDGRRIRHEVAATKILKWKGLPEMYWQPSAIRLVRRERPDVVIALGTPYSLTAWTLAFVGKVTGIPVLLWGHGLLAKERGAKWWVRRALYKLAAGQLLYGDYAKRLLVEEGFDPASLHVVYNSLDYDIQEKVASRIQPMQTERFRNALGIAEGEGFVVFTGRIQPVKRLDLLVRAIGMLAQRGKAVHVGFVGEGSEKDALARLAADLDVTRLVHWLGVSYDEEFLGLVLSASDLSVIPSGAGLSIMHAMVFGTPVLISDRIESHFPEWEAVQEGRTGFFYRYGDVNDLADKIEAAIFPAPRKPAMMAHCKAVIRERYNPHVQLQRFVTAVEGAARS